MAVKSHRLGLNTFFALFLLSQSQSSIPTVSTLDNESSNATLFRTTLGRTTNVLRLTNTASTPSSTRQTTGHATSTPSSTRQTAGHATATLTVTTETTEQDLAQCFNAKSNTTIKWWRYYEGYCYNANNNRFFTYDEGKEFCKRNGAILTSVHSASEMDFIRSLVQPHSSRFWIGLRKIYSETKWEDGTPVDYLNWSSDEYSDDEDFDFSDSDDLLVTAYSGDRSVDPDVCASFIPRSGMWEKTSCDNRYPVVCKFKNESDDLITTAITPYTLAGFCPDEWYTFGDKCYKVIGKSAREYKGFDAASQECQAMESTLVSIHSAEEQAFLDTIILDVRSKILIGLRRETVRGPFRWEDNSPLDFLNWNEGEPNDHLDTQENCVQMLFGFSSILGKWNDVPCRLKFAYICQKYKDPMITKPGVEPSVCTQPAGWLKIRTSCYEVFHETGSATTWLEAQSLCESHGGKLASLRSFVVTAELRTHMEELEGYFWIGINSTAKRKYTWIGGAPLIYSNWQIDQPNEVSDEHNCVAMNVEAEWMVRDCNETLPFVCEVTEEAPEAPTLPPHQPDMICPETSLRWHDFGGKYCYIIEVKEKLSWYDASCRCTREGGFLASFHSAEEINLMLYHLKDIEIPVHIGLERDVHGHFIWSDGSTIDFDNWNRGQPSSKKEQCSEMHTATGKWNDILCGEGYGYICSTLKVPVKEEPLPESDKLEGGSLSAGIISLIVISVLSVLVISAVALYYVYPSAKPKMADNVPFARMG